MARTILIQGFKGGLGDDAFENLGLQTFQNARDLDVFTGVNLLMPHTKLANDAGIPTGSSELLKKVIFGSDNKYYFTGKKDILSAVNFALYSVPRTGGGALGASSTYTLVDNFVDSSPKSPIEEFEDYFYYFKSTNTLRRYGLLSGTPSSGDLSTGLSAAGTHLKNHRGLKRLYFAHSKYIGWYDGTTLNLTALTLAIGESPVGIEEYGRFVLVGSNANYGKSKIIIWDGNSPYIEDTIDLGGNTIRAFKNVNGTIHVVASDLIAIKLILCTPGSKPIVVKEIPYTTRFAPGDAGDPSNAVCDSFNDLFSFGITGASFDVSSALDYGIYTYGTKNQKYPKVFSLDRLISTGLTNISINDIKYIDSELIVIYQTSTSVYAVNHTRANATLGTKSANGVYETEIFPVNDGLPGKISKIILNHNPIPSSCGFTVQIKQFGHYPWTGSVPTDDSYQDLITNQGSGSSTGKTQSTNNAFMTEIGGNELFKTCRYAQIKIKFDEISTVNAASIVFPIIINTV